MTAIPAHAFASRSELRAWARRHGATVTVADETCDYIIYQAEIALPGGTRQRCICRETFPPHIALKRRNSTYTVSLSHHEGSAVCHHVENVVPETSSPSMSAPVHLAGLVAAARTEEKHKRRCGASIESLTVVSVARTYGVPDHPTDWTGW
ncbi:hypothetical protein [Nocardiopsis rhodophaea]|uniref:hypothetical protein n=1 Tax=Nocardiopsis rhodophaea TaxID=280238 RepID=UPI0031D2A7BD